METTILSTKLFVPEPRPDLVNRDRLFDLMDQCLHKKITLISAPAGFGKSTLIADWLKESGTQAGWLSLDPEDNDSNRFLVYFFAMLQPLDENIGRDISGILQSSQPPDLQSILAILINDVAESKNEFLVILDDYHVISSSKIHEGMKFLMENIPNNLHLVISTREDTTLPLGKMRARGELLEIRARDLRFNVPEVTDFLQNCMSLDISPGQIGALDQKTEGWIAGLQLAAISMKNKPDIDGFIASFTGNHRFIIDYLVDEVLENLDANKRAFLLQTSILDSMNASLCQAVTGEKNSQKMLDEFDWNNLFLIPLDDERNWYRYHHLFAEFLQTKFGNEHPERIAEFHLKACEWHQKHGNIDQAFSHAISANDDELAASIIEPHCMPMIKYSRLARLHHWIFKLPKDTMKVHPWICIAATWERLLSGSLEDANSFLGFAESFASKNQPADLDRINGHIYTIKAYLIRWQDGDNQKSIEQSLIAKEHIPLDSIIARSALFINLGNCYYLTGQLTAAIEPLNVAIEVAENGGNYYVALAAFYTLGLVQIRLGALHKAEETFKEAIKKGTAWGSGKPIPSTSYGYVGLGQVLYEKNMLDDARTNLEKGIQLAELINEVSVVLDGTFALCQVFLAQNQIELAQQQCRHANAILQRSTRAQAISQSSALQALMWDKKSDLDHLEFWINKHLSLVKQKLEYMKMPEYLMLSRLLIARDQLTPVFDLLSKLQSRAEQQGWKADLISILALQSMAYHAQGDQNLAVDYLKQALLLARPEGFLRTLADKGNQLESILRSIEIDGEFKDFVHDLKIAFLTDRPSGSSQQQSLIEPISDRELELLSLIAQGFTNHQIAERLFLSPNTVKSHLRNIYQKLGVNNRTSAVAEAREINLLPLD